MIVCEHDTAVVILSYNGKTLHQLFLPEIIKQSVGKYDVILVDNASTDDTYSFVSNTFPEVKLLKIDINKGFAHGYATTLQQIQATYYVMLSADFEVTNHWFEPLHSLMEQNKNIAACQPKILYYKDKKMFEYAGAGGGFMDTWGYMFCRGRIFDTLEEDTQQYNDTIETFWASGGCMFLRSSSYHEVGGLDADLYAHMEEIDLCWRLQHANYTIAYCGASTVYHVGGSVISYGSPAKIYYNYRNSLLLLTKNLPASRALWFIPFRLVLDGASGARALFKGNTKEVGAIVKAHWHYFSMLPKWIQKRKKITTIKPLQKLQGIYNGTVMLDYFFRNKKYFGQLQKNKISYNGRKKD